MIKTEKKHLTLNIDSEIAQRAVDDPNIKVSEITEKFLQALTTISKKENEEKIYNGYQKLFNIMLPLLQKFKVSTHIANQVVSLFSPPEGFDDEGNEIYGSPEPDQWFDTFLLPDGSLVHDNDGPIHITDIDIGDFLRPEQIIDEFLDSIQEGAEYSKKQFKEIEMAKTIIDAITKGVIPKSKGVKKVS